jgi:hypothetical protein
VNLTVVVAGLQKDRHNLIAEQVTPAQPEVRHTEYCAGAWLPAAASAYEPLLPITRPCWPAPANSAIGANLRPESFKNLAAAAQYFIKRWAARLRLLSTTTTPTSLL